MTEFEVYQDNGGEYRWKLQANNNQIIATSGEGYKSKDDCLNGIKLVQEGAAGANINDTTAAETPAAN